MKNNILIIGFGNIGERHFQSFYNLNKKINIFIVEKKFKKTSDLIKNKYNKNKKINIQIFNNLSKLKNYFFFLTIVATNSDVRYFFFKKLINQFNSKHIILEKVLFKNSKELDRSIKLIQNYSKKIWINLPRREYPLMQYVCSKLDFKKKIYIEFSGFKWGMASNMIHFLDLFKWMTRANKITFEDKLESKIYKAKRKGFYEVRGKIIFKDQNDNKLKIIDDKKCAKNKFKIINEDKVFLIKNNIIYIRYKKKKNFIVFPNTFQSNLTNKIYFSLIKNNSCKLPELKNSIDIHKVFYSIIEKKMKNKLFT